MVIALNNFDSTKDYFAVLGVHHDACDKTIKLAYRKMARRYHPDVSKIYNAVVKFQEVAEAFEVLTKKHKESYCRTLKSRNTNPTNPKKHTGAKNKNQHSQPGFSRIMSLKIPDNYRENDYVKVENMGLPADSKNLAGHLFTKFVEA